MSKEREDLANIGEVNAGAGTRLEMSIEPQLKLPMNASLFDKCRAYLSAQDFPSRTEEYAPRPVVTISRETGAGAITIGARVVERLEAYFNDHQHPWAVFDENLVTKALEDHGHRKAIARYMPEDHVPAVENLVEEMLGAHPAASLLFQHMNLTIRTLAAMGNVVLVGRGANFVTAQLKNVLNVRLVSPLEQRIQHIAQYFHMDHEAALKFVHEADRGRARYVRKHFHHDVNDPLHYHLTINTGRIGFEAAAEMIEHAVRRMVAGQAVKSRRTTPGSRSNVRQERLEIEEV